MSENRLKFSIENMFITIRININNKLVSAVNYYFNLFRLNVGNV